MQAFFVNFGKIFQFGQKKTEKNFVSPKQYYKKRPFSKKKVILFSKIKNFNYYCKAENLFFYEPFSLKKRLHGFFRAKKDILLLSEYLPGNFNNHNQNLTDLTSERESISPHEHIHCFIEKMNNNSEEKAIFFARYFFPSPSPKLFRLRLYVIYPCEFSTKEKPVTKMEIIRNSEKNKYEAQKQKKFSQEKANRLFKDGTTLSNCIIFWKKIKENGKNRYSSEIFQGFMENQGCTILTASSFSFLHIKDDLILSAYSFWVNDRGFTEDGELLYGNKNGIAFQMERMVVGNYFHWSFGDKFPETPLNKKIK